jgi:hypothetical protein
MTVNEMLERLQEAADNGFGECEVRLAFQSQLAAAIHRRRDRHAGRCVARPRRTRRRTG